MSHSLWPHGLWHTRLLSPSLSPRICSDSCPFSQWCCLTNLSSAAPFSFCLQSFPASRSFQMSWLFTLGSQSIAASATVFFSEYSGLISFKIDWLDLFAVQGILKSLLQHHSSKHHFSIVRNRTWVFVLIKKMHLVEHSSKGNYFYMLMTSRLFARDFISMMGIYLIQRCQCLNLWDRHILHINFILSTLFSWLA